MAGKAVGPRENVKLRGDLQSYPVAYTATIYAGSLVGIDANGFLNPMSAKAALQFVGVAEETVDGTLIVAGANPTTLATYNDVSGATCLWCRVRQHNGMKMQLNAGWSVTLADLGKRVYGKTAQSGSANQDVMLHGGTLTGYTSENSVGTISQINNLSYNFPQLTVTLFQALPAT